MQIGWIIKFLRFEAQRHRVSVVLNFFILLLVALAMHLLMRSQGLWDYSANSYAAVLLSQTLTYVMFILCAPMVITFALLFGRKDRDNANIYQLKLSPHSTYALQFLRFTFFFGSLCIYTLLIISMSLLAPLPEEISGFHDSLFVAGSYLLFALLLPMLACIFLCFEINHSYVKGGKTLAVVQAMGFCVFWFYLVPVHCWDLLASIHFLPPVHLTFPPLGEELPKFQDLSSLEIAVEPLLVAVLFAVACIYLAGKVVKESEV